MMSKAEWFAVRKPNTGGIIATSANQIVPLKFRRPTKMYYIHQTSLSFSVLKGGLGMRLGDILCIRHHLSAWWVTCLNYTTFGSYCYSQTQSGFCLATLEDKI